MRIRLMVQFSIVISAKIMKSEDENTRTSKNGLSAIEAILG